MANVIGPQREPSILDIAPLIVFNGYHDEGDRLQQTCRFLYREDSLNRAMVNHRRGPEGTTRLWAASFRGDISRMKELLRYGAKPSQEDFLGRDLLSSLIRGPLNGGHLLSVLAVLVASPLAQLNTLPGKESLLNEAVAINDAGVIELLLRAGADVNLASGSIPQTPLMRAVSGGHLELARLLTRHRADVHATDSYGRTVLSMLRGFRTCTGHEGFACLELLLACGADATGVHGSEALRAIMAVSTSVAARFKDAPALVMRLLKAGATLSNWGFNLGELRRLVVQAHDEFSMLGDTQWTPEPATLVRALHASVPDNKRAHFARDILAILIARSIDGADAILSGLSELEVTAVSPVLLSPVLVDEEYSPDAEGEFEQAHMTRMPDTLDARRPWAERTRDADPVKSLQETIDGRELSVPVPSVVPARSWARKAARNGNAAFVHVLMLKYPMHAQELLILLLYYGGWSESITQASPLLSMLTYVQECPHYDPSLSVAIQGMACTLMAVCARQGLDVLVKQVLDSGLHVDVHIRWHVGLSTTALGLACVCVDNQSKGTVQQAKEAREARGRTVQVLLEAGADPNAVIFDESKQVSSPFIVALTSARDAGREPCLVTLGALIEYRAEVSKSFTDRGKQYTPVVFAEFRGWTAAARLIQDRVRKLRAADSGEEAVLSLQTRPTPRAKPSV